MTGKRARLLRAAGEACTATGLLLIVAGVPACWAMSGWCFASARPREGWEYLFLFPVVIAFCGYALVILPWASGTRDG